MNPPVRAPERERLRVQGCSSRLTTQRFAVVCLAACTALCHRLPPSRSTLYQHRACQQPKSGERQPRYQLTWLSSSNNHSNAQLNLLFP